MSILSFILNIKTPTDFSDNSFDINSESKKNFFNKDFVDIGSNLNYYYSDYIFALIINYNIRLGKIPYSTGKYVDFTSIPSEIIKKFNTFPKQGGDADMRQYIAKIPELYIFALILNDTAHYSNNSNIKEIDINKISTMPAPSGGGKILVEKFKKNRNYYIYALILNDIYQSAYLFPKNFAIQSDVFKAISKSQNISQSQSISSIDTKKSIEKFTSDKTIDDIRYHRMGTF